LRVDLSYSEGGADFVITLTNANEEYEVEIPANTTGIEFQCRTSAAVRYSFVAGKVATPTDPYRTLKSDGVYRAGDLFFNGQTLYLASASAGVVVEGSFRK